jgi:calcineurin-like phosphoesterase family protein
VKAVKDGAKQRRIDECIDGSLITGMDEHMYVMSDTHFGHANMIRYSPARCETVRSLLGREPTTADHRVIDELLVTRWNATVNDDDTILHLGDFTLYPKLVPALTKRLNGRKVLLRGNHDDKGAAFYEALGWRVVAKPQLPPTSTCIVATINGAKVFFSHVPVFQSPGAPDEAATGNNLENLDELFNAERCDVNVHGHIHDRVPLDARCINVSAEAINYTPVRVGSLIDQWHSRSSSRLIQPDST